MASIFSSHGPSLCTFPSTNAPIASLAIRFARLDDRFGLPFRRLGSPARELLGRPGDMMLIGAFGLNANCGHTYEDRKLGAKNPPIVRECQVLTVRACARSLRDRSAD